MNKRIMSGLIAGGAVALSGGKDVWANSAPEVTNVTANQRTDGSKLVDIGYDLADADGDPCTVWVAASDDGGVTWKVPAVTVAGDLGAGTEPGTGKQIVWDAGTDLPGVFGTDYVVRIHADDGYTPPPSMVPVPGGEFDMGDHHDGMAEALPVHAVYVDSFYRTSTR